MNYSVVATRWLVASLCILFAQSSTYAGTWVFATDDISVTGVTGGHQYYVEFYRVDVVNRMYIATPTTNPPVDYVQISAVDVMPGMKRYTYHFPGGTYTSATASYVYGKVYLKSTTGGADTFIKNLDPTAAP